MNIFSTNILTNQQYDEIQELINDCRKHDESAGVIFLEADMNEYQSFPCFHFLYEESKLTSFLSIFVPHEEECEIYAYTSPEFRRKGYFKKLFQIANKSIKEYKIKNTLIVTEPQVSLCTKALESINAKFECSDYMLKYNILEIPIPKNILSIKKTEKHFTIKFETYLGRKKVGECKVDQSHGSSTIYDLEIDKAQRGKGYGTETLLLILNQLIKSNCDNILLHISGNNTIALEMYLKHGFIVLKQIDYWKVI